MNALRRLSLAVWLFCVSVAHADPVQDQLDRIAQEMTQLSLAAINGEIDADVAAARMEALLERDMLLRTGKLTAQDRALRWQDQGDAPLKAPGARLIAVGLPDEFDSAVWGLLDDGRKVDLIAEARADVPHSVDVYVPDHPDGPGASGTLTVHFADAGSLRVTIAPRLDIPEALPVVMRLVIGDLVARLNKNGVDHQALLAQFRADAGSVDPELGYAAATLFIWSEAGRGDPVFRFLRSGRLEGPFWDSLGQIPDPDVLNRAYASVLQNSGALEKLMRLQQGEIDKIRYVVPGPRGVRPDYLSRVKVESPPPPEEVGLREISDLLIEGRAREYNRKVILNSAKDAQKVMGYTAFEPVTMTGAALVGGVLTMADKYMKTEDYNYPTTMSLAGQAVPGDPLLADDDRKVFGDMVITAKGEPYEVRVFSDGLDASLAVLDLATSATALGKAANAIGKAKGARKIEDQVAQGLDKIEDYWLGQATAVTKDGLEAVEKQGDAVEKGSFNAITIPARTWTAKVEPHTFRRYLSVGYRGEVAWDVRDFHALACWKNTQEGISATVTTKSNVFGGLFDRLDLGWAVQDPEITLTVEPSVIRPGGTAEVTATTSGAQQTNVQFGTPSLGALSNVGNFDATYGAPAKLSTCQEFVPITATFPPPGARICAPPAKAVSGVVIAKGDALVRTPATLTCRDGEVLGFTVTHPENAPVMCRLDGPGTLTMVGNEGLLDCPVKPRQNSSITCYTGARPGTCAPVIPINRIYPEFAVYAQVSADRRYQQALNDEVDGFFNDCGIEDPTALVLELMDLGTGLADGIPVDPVSNNCPRQTQTAASGGGGVSGSGGGSPSTFEGKAEGGYVAVWPLGEGRDISVSDSNSYSHRPYDPGRGPGDRSVFVASDVSASVTLDGPERFVVRTEGVTKASSIRAASEIPTPTGGFAEWSVWRRIVVTRDVAVTATIATSGPATHLVQAIPVRLENNVPVSLLAGFDQNLTPVMRVGQTRGFGLGVPQLDTSTVVLPGPRNDRDSLTYLIRFGGRVTPAEVGENEVSAASQTTVKFEIRPVE